MADYITKIRTSEGDKQIDYNALANLPDVGEEWNKLNITLDSDVASVTFEIPQAKEVFMIGLLRLNDAENTLNTGEKSYKMLINGSLASYPKTYLRQENKFFNVWEIKKIDTFTKVYRTPAMNNGHTWSQSYSISLDGWSETIFDTSKTINTIEFAQYESGYVFPSDCTWEVWYR